MKMREGNWLSLVLLLLPALAVGQEAQPEVEAPTPQVHRSEGEEAILPLVDPVGKRFVLRNEQNLHDVWLISTLNFEKVAEAVRQAISTKRALPGGLRVDHWTWLEPDRSYVLELAGGTKPYRMRLTRHLNGSLLELENAGVPADAPRWAPPYRPRPILLPHGQNR